MLQSLLRLSYIGQHRLGRGIGRRAEKARRLSQQPEHRIGPTQDALHVLRAVELLPHFVDRLRQGLAVRAQDLQGAVRVFGQESQHIIDRFLGLVQPVERLVGHPLPVADMEDGIQLPAPVGHADVLSWIAMNLDGPRGRFVIAHLHDNGVTAGEHARTGRSKRAAALFSSRSDAFAREIPRRAVEAGPRFVGQRADGITARVLNDDLCASAVGGHVTDERSVRAVLADVLGVGEEPHPAHLLDHVLDGRWDLEQGHRGGARDVGHGRYRSQGAHVIQDVRGPSVRPDHEVVVPRVDHERANRGAGQPVGPQLPVGAAVQGHVHPVLGSEVEEIGIDGILFHDVDEALDLVRHETLPVPAEIRRLIDERGIVRAAVVVEHDECGGGIELRGLDVRHPSVLGHAANPVHHVGPRCAVILRDLHVPVVRPDPDHTGLDRARRDREDRGVVLRGGDVVGEAAARELPLLLRIVRGEIGTDDLPRFPHIAAPVHELTAVVHTPAARVGVEARVPVEPQRRPVRMGRAHTLAFVGNEVTARDESAL